MAPKNTIPEGFELIGGRGREKARAALDLATERGFAEAEVKVRPDGYLVPISSEDAAAAAVPGETLTPSDPNEASQAGTPADGEDSTAIVEEIELPTKKDDIIAFAEENNIDLDGATNNEQRLAAIRAEIERRTQEAEKSGVLSANGEQNSIEQDDTTPAGENADDTPKGD